LKDNGGKGLSMVLTAQVGGVAPTCGRSSTYLDGEISITFCDIIKSFYLEKEVLDVALFPLF